MELPSEDALRQNTTVTFHQTIVTRLALPLSIASLSGSLCIGWAQDSSWSGDKVIVIEREGKVEIMPAAAGRWFGSLENQVLDAGDQLRTLEKSRAVVAVPARSHIRLGQLSLLQMPPEESLTATLLRGVLYFFHRDKPGTHRILTPTVSTLIRGTEFNLRVEENGTTTLTLFDGEAEMENDQGQLPLVSGQEGVAEPGQAPKLRRVVLAKNIIQWALYYPAVVELEELGLASDAQGLLRDSLTAYRTGDLLRALDEYPVNRQPTSEEERVYLAALLLAVGQVEKSEALLLGMTANDTVAERPGRLADALRQGIAAVHFEEWNRPGTAGGAKPSAREGPELASEWLAESYYRQSLSDLDGALAAVRKAVARSPFFGPAWVRLAELEFSFGRVRPAARALEAGLTLAPRQARGLALSGFVLAAENRIADALQAFDEAIEIDGALGDAWLGRGLCRIRRGRAREGLVDLEVAALLEPQRAILRSYLGKAFSNAGDPEQARKELELARRLDENDPTAWLYLALLNQQGNLINQAVRDLERSQQLNKNRQVYRSRLLLDQDRAVRGANLADIYLDAGLVEPGVREAARAVGADYANFSAHLFLAQSYNALRDPRQVNLRYETPWLNEYLVANLLAPVASGTLSPLVTQQEYSRLFERNRLGLTSITEYSSQGDWLQAAAQSGTFYNTAWVVEEVYRSRNGDRPNGELEDLTLGLRLKHELTAHDSLYLQASYYDFEGGDLASRYSEDMVNRTLHIEERQEPIVLAGYHRRWGPGSDTLLLAGRLDDTAHVSNGQHQTVVLDRSQPGGAISDVIPTLLDEESDQDLEIYLAEAQQIWRRNQHTFIFGGRVQSGQFETRSRQDNPRYPFPSTNTFSASQDVSPDYARLGIYGHYYWQITSPLLLVAGLSYDWIKFPLNHQFGPVSGDEDQVDRFGPKAGLIWTPFPDTTVRGAYARGLGGVSFEQSFRLEPTQVAGFNHAFRNLLPESEAGSAPVPQLDTAGVALEQRFRSQTYVGVYGEWLSSDAARTVGVFEYRPGFQEASARERLDYQERSVGGYLHQLLGDQWSVGARYRFSKAELASRFNLPASVDFVPKRDLASSLHTVNLFALCNHPSGFFGRLDALWMKQDNQGYSPRRSGADFWQFNLWLGYRFPLRRVELRLGLLNLTDRDYRLNPLNLTPELPRERTLAANLRFNF